MFLCISISLCVRLFVYGGEYLEQRNHGSSLILEGKHFISFESDLPPQHFFSLAVLSSLEEGNMHYHRC